MKHKNAAVGIIIAAIFLPSPLWSRRELPNLDGITNTPAKDVLSLVAALFQLILNITLALQPSTLP